MDSKAGQHDQRINDIIIPYLILLCESGAKFLEYTNKHGVVYSENTIEVTIVHNVYISFP